MPLWDELAKIFYFDFGFILLFKKSWIKNYTLVFCLIKDGQMITGVGMDLRIKRPRTV